MLKNEIKQMVHHSCKRFTFPAKKQYDGKDVTCVALVHGFDSLDEEDAYATRGQLKVEECE